MRTFGKRGGFVQVLSFAVTRLLLAAGAFQANLVPVPPDRAASGDGDSYHHPPHGFPFQPCPRVLNLCC